jgi:hypothetical protein
MRQKYSSVNPTWVLIRSLGILILFIFIIPIRLICIIVFGIFGGLFLGYSRNQPNHRNVFKG